jgi:dTMP kinase
MTRGLLITLEGGEGAGKTTQARKIRDYLQSLRREVVLTREPGGTPEAEKIRDLLVQRDGGAWTPIAECTLFFAARQMHVETLIKPAIAEGKVVVCDRFTDSTRAYQGYGHGFDLEVIENLNGLILNSFTPDLTFIFDLDVETGLRRSFSHNKAAGGVETTEDKFELLDKKFHERMRQGYLQIAKDSPERCKIIDASKEPDAIFKDIQQVLGEVLNHVV